MWIRAYMTNFNSFGTTSVFDCKASGFSKIVWNMPQSFINCTKMWLLTHNPWGIVNLPTELSELNLIVLLNWIWFLDWIELNWIVEWNWIWLFDWIEFDCWIELNLIVGLNWIWFLDGIEFDCWIELNLIIGWNWNWLFWWNWILLFDWIEFDCFIQLNLIVWRNWIWLLVASFVIS